MPDSGIRRTIKITGAVLLGVVFVFIYTTTDGPMDEVQGPAIATAKKPTQPASMRSRDGAAVNNKRLVAATAAGATSTAHEPENTTVQGPVTVPRIGTAPSLPSPLPWKFAVREQWW